MARIAVRRAPRGVAGPIAPIASAGGSTEAKAPGIVTTAQHSYLRVRVRLQELSTDTHAEREHQLHIAAQRAAEAGDSPREHRLLSRARTRYGARELLCRARSLLKKVGGRVLVGDAVMLRGIDWVEERGVVESVRERSIASSQPPVANFDQVLVVCALAQPEPEPWQLTNFLLAAERTGARVVPVLTKSDTCTNFSDLREWTERVRLWGYPETLATSVAIGEGIDDVEQLLKNRVSVLLGPSGAGKSSIINRLKLDGLAQQRQQLDCNTHGNSSSTEGDSANLLQSYDEAKEHLPKEPVDDEEEDSANDYISSSSNGNERKDESILDEQAEEMLAQLPKDVSATSSVRGGGGARDEGFADGMGLLQSVRQVSKSGAGRHTTCNVSLLPMPHGGYLADTPGFRLPDIAREAEPHEVQWLFPELRWQLENAGGIVSAICTFNDCSHRHEPGCGIDKSFERYNFYTQVLAKVEEAARMRSKRKAKDAATRVKTKRGGIQETEARLSTKGHKRMSKRKQRQRLQEKWSSNANDND